MNRDGAKYLLPFIQAYVDGKDVQVKSDYGPFTGKWIYVSDPQVWDSTAEYLIKPEPREFWLNPETGHFTKLVPGFLTNDWIKVREVLDDE